MTFPVACDAPAIVTVRLERLKTADAIVGAGAGGVAVGTAVGTAVAATTGTAVAAAVAVKWRAVRSRLR